MQKVYKPKGRNRQIHNRRCCYWHPSSCIWYNIRFEKISKNKENLSNTISAAAAAKSLQSCPTLCDPKDSSPPGSTIPGILQARTLEWVAISFSNAWKWKVKVKSLSHVWLLVTPWIAAYQAPLSMGFSRQEYWSGLPSPSPIFMCSFYLNSEIQKSGDIWLHLLIWRKNNSCPQKLCNAVNAKDRGWGLKTKLKLTSLPVLSVSTALWGHQFKGLGKLHHLPHRKTIHLSQLKLSHSLK